MSRWKAASIHLSISIAIGLISAALIFGVWYPPPYSQAMGAFELVFLLMGVDIVLGPLLTLVVFKSGKKYLRVDLAIIALAQACAMGYGLSVVVRARPVFIVGEVDRFALVAANDLDPRDLAKASNPQFLTLPWTGPRIVGAEIPTDPRLRNELVFSGAKGKDIDKFPQFYVEYSRVTKQLITHAQPLDTLQRKHPESTAVIDAWLHAHPGDAANVTWLPLNTRRMSLTMLIDRNTGNVLGALPIDPW